MPSRNVRACSAVSGCISVRAFAAASTRVATFRSTCPCFRKDAWSPDGKRREVMDAELYEVSIATGWPAYPATTAQIAA